MKTNIEITNYRDLKGVTTPTISSINIADSFRVSHLEILQIINRITSDLTNNTPVGDLFINSTNGLDGEILVTKEAFLMLIKDFTDVTSLETRSRYLEALDDNFNRLNSPSSISHSDILNLISNSISNKGIKSTNKFNID